MSFQIRTTLPESPHAPNITLVAIFDFTQIFGFILLVIVLLSAWLSKTVHRSRAWFNFLFTWTLSCISYLVILGQQAGEEPPFSVCLLQAMLVYAAPPLTVTAGLCYLIEMWLVVTNTGPSSRKEGTSHRDYRAIIAAPYIVHFIVCTEILILGLTHRDLVKRNGTSTYCHLETELPAYITSGVTICGILIAMVFFICTIIYIRKHLAASRLVPGQRVLNVQKMIIRFGIFSILPVLGLLLSVIQVTVMSSGISDGILNIATGTLPAEAALVFGTQTDIMRVWWFWRKPITLQTSSDPTLLKPESSTDV
ncbi:hypothetical protein AB1N83_007374 [Pleurotus pulmonarius]